LLRIGIVGGGIRGRMYAQSLHGFPNAEVAAICDLNLQAAEKVASPFGLHAYPDHRSMLDDAELDAVIVATPDFAHTDVAVDAANRGLHLLIEKPVATTSEDVARIAEAVEGGGVECMVGFENRWNPAIRHLRQLSESGQFGSVLTQNITLSNTYYVPLTMLPWAEQTSPAWFLMSHTIDAATWISGRPVESVVARGSRGRLAELGVDTWDVIHALLTFADGTTANLTSTWVLPESLPSIVDFKYQVVGSRSSADVDLQDQGVRHAGDAYRWPGTLGGEIDGRLQGPPTWMAQSFVTRLTDGEPVSPGLHEGAAVTDVVLAVLASLRTGETQSLTPTLPSQIA
jgi:predicted dehydrogenase